MFIPLYSTIHKYKIYVPIYIFHGKKVKEIRFRQIVFKLHFGPLEKNGLLSKVSLTALFIIQSRDYGYL